MCLLQKFILFTFEFFTFCSVFDGNFFSTDLVTSSLPMSFSIPDIPLSAFSPVQSGRLGMVM